MHMPSSWQLLSCDSLARSVFLCAGFCQPFSFPPPLPLSFVGFFSTDVLSVTGACSFPCLWGLIAGLHCCASHWALFQSRVWLPIVEAPGYSRHPTSILAMQLFNGTISDCNYFNLPPSPTAQYRYSCLGMTPAPDGQT